MMPILLSGLVVFITHSLEAVTGFGCSVLAMPFVTALLGIRMGVMVITVLAWILALYFAVVKFRDIDWKQYGIITGFMLLGLPLGMYLFRSVDSTNLKMILAIFILTVSAYQLYRLGTNKETKAPLKARSAVPYYLLLIAGGIIHGIFSSGGPLVVLYASRQLQQKGKFRATLCLLWTTLNTIIIATYLIEGSFTAPIAKTTALLVPFVLAGIVAGEKIHDKVNERTFSLIVFGMLFLTAIFMLIF
ncbi:MAG: sulfite exporter TauE/SafE family protein [Sphaerochaeta sp.]|nr:sulfite exporter TauE/SafE family protein [Sphaerochaeta sp.]